MDIRGKREPNVDKEDPTANVQELYTLLDKKLFKSELKENGVLLEWSQENSSMTGYCYQLKDDVRRVNRYYIVLNKPLLMSRKREDLVDALLHQMIHAMLFLRGVEERNGGHGLNFFRIMKNINKIAGTNITLSHTLTDLTDLKEKLEDLKNIIKLKEKEKTPKPILKKPKHLGDHLNDPRRNAIKLPFQPGVPSPMQNKRYKALKEIHKAYGFAISNDAVRMIGYDSDSEPVSLDYDSASNYYDRSALMWLDYIKTLKDVKPWLRSLSPGPRR